MRYSISRNGPSTATLLDAPPRHALRSGASSKGVVIATRVIIIGGGLAGSEAAWQAARRGHPVDLHEMRPVRTTPVHATGDLADLVCSNSLKSNLLDTASSLLKEEMRRCDSLIIRVADTVKVPAGGALAVDRERFARGVTEAIQTLPSVRVVREEVKAIPSGGPCIVATGPLASDAIAESIAGFTGRGYLYFYDAISPIIDADSIDTSMVFRASRYGKGGEDYLNGPLTEQEYDRFYEALLGAAEAPTHEFEKEINYFEGCLPIEEMARRGRDTLLFGPMKPVGLIDPKTGRQPFAVVQLRQGHP